MRAWIRIGLVALIVLLGIRAWVLRPDGEAAPPAEAAAPAAEPPDTSPGEAAAALITETLQNAGQRSGSQMAWRITRLNWADGILVFDVESERPDDARAIAEEIVEPLDDSYEEVLIYVRAPANANDPLLRRVRWTPDEGYVETAFAER